MSSDKRPKPMAEGSFSKTPFSHILVYLHGKKVSGTLEVSGHDGRDSVSIYFRDGMPAKIKSSFKGKGLGQILFDLGQISQEQLRECQKEMTTVGGFAGEILIRHGAVDPPALIRGLRGQLLLKTVDVFAMPDGEYAFYEKVNLLVGDGPDELLPTDPYPILMAGTRTHAKAMKLDHVLGTLAGRWISLEGGDSLKSYRFTREEQELCRELMGRPKKLEELVEGGRHNRQTVRSVVYVLLITKELKLHEAAPDQAAPSIPPGPRQKFDSIAPKAPSAESSDPQIRKARKEILEKATLISNQNYYEMLQVQLGAPVEDVRKSFFRLAKVFHPDRANREGLTDLKETLEYIFSNLSEAHSTLLDPDTRSEYGAAISEGINRTSNMPSAGDEEEVNDVLEAEKLFQKAQVLLRREQYDKGLALVDRARELNPKEGEYLAMWAKLKATVRDRGAPVDDLINHLRQAEEMSPNSVRVHFYLGQLLKRDGKESEALTHFKKVLEVNPRHIEAAREVRIMEMRKSKEKEKKGFLSRFLK